jgi:hypothetical protein
LRSRRLQDNGGSLLLPEDSDRQTA